MHGKNLVYIIGFMGSGKSTAGKKLAAALGWDFIDLDRKIEAEAGKSITEIFSQDSEERFRSLETEVLRSLQSHVKTIVSTGGGRRRLRESSGVDRESPRRYQSRSRQSILFAQTGAGRREQLSKRHRERSGS